ncbi:MAG: hypothetical protein ABSA83_21650, partial [Verrucomicrobiota bacterium]
AGSNHLGPPWMMGCGFNFTLIFIRNGGPFQLFSEANLDTSAFARQRTTVSLRWVSERLGMGDQTNASCSPPKNEPCGVSETSETTQTGLDGRQRKLKT